MKIHNLDISHFLKHHWQKKPLLIKNGFPNFEDFLDEHELAGLAQEQEIDSRVVCFHDDKWFLEPGPIQDFESVLKGQWSLLVQGVEKYFEEGEDLLSCFDFIPKWRTDDLMVSYSVAGAGVGPHLDQYDVFIVQGRGKRRWKVGENGNYQETCPHPKLRQIKDFTPIIDAVLETGDIIYIPPGCPHDGQTVEQGFNYSVGFRAPEQVQLLSEFADFAIQEITSPRRYSDRDLSLRSNNYEIKQQEIENFRSLLSDLIESKHFDTFLLRYLTQSPESPNHSAEIEDLQQETLDALNEGRTFYRNEVVSAAFKEPTEGLGIVSAAVQGEKYDLPSNEADLLKIFLNSKEWHNKSKLFFNNGSLFVLILSKLVFEGSWEIEQ